MPPGTQAEWFVGGSAELADLRYLTAPPEAGAKPRLLNKYGFRTETGGTVKVRRDSQRWALPPGHMAASVACNGVAATWRTAFVHGKLKHRKQSNIS